ncbi:hypothetical protein CPB86DRAFT_785431, partial [Serendipita vermifera]
MALHQYTRKQWLEARKQAEREAQKQVGIHLAPSRPPPVLGFSKPRSPSPRLLRHSPPRVQGP